MQYNTRRETFPNIIVANFLNFAEARPFEVESEKERQAPRRLLRLNATIGRSVASARQSSSDRLIARPGDAWLPTSSIARTRPESERAGWSLYFALAVVLIIATVYAAVTAILVGSRSAATPGRTADLRPGPPRGRRHRDRAW